MKDLYMVRVAVITKQDREMVFAEEITFAFSTLAHAEEYAAQLLEMNKEWMAHFGQEPIGIVETRMVSVPDSPDEAATVILDRLQNGDVHFAKFAGLEPVDTNSELERIRRSVKP